MSEPCPDKTLVIEVLAEAASAAANESSSSHPEDIACEMLNAIEHAAVTLTILWKRGVL